MKTLQQFKDALKAILNKQEKQELLVNKALRMEEVLQKARRVYAVGEIRHWKDGNRYKKMVDGKWRRFYPQDERSKSMENAAKKIVHEIDMATSATKLWQIVTKHKDRFSKENGTPHSIVKELRACTTDTNVQKNIVKNIDNYNNGGKIYTTIPSDLLDDEKVFYKMDRAHLKNFIKNNIAESVDCGKLDTIILADFCAAWKRVTNFVLNLPKLRKFSFAQFSEQNIALFDPDNISIKISYSATKERTEKQGVKNDNSRNVGRLAWSTLRDTGNGMRDALIHEFGHYIDWLGFHIEGTNRMDAKWVQYKCGVLFTTQAEGTCPSLYGGDESVEENRSMGSLMNELFAECFACYAINGKQKLTDYQNTMIRTAIETVKQRIGGAK